MSPTATTSTSFPLPTIPCSSIARYASRPIRPNPLIAIFTVICFYSLRGFIRFYRSYPKATTRRALRRQDAAEDHPPRGSLQYAGHVDLHFLADVIAAPFDHDHRAVVEIAHTLPHFLARL